jgi:hypothetical protein
MGDHRAEAHGACPLPLSLLLITCSAEKKVDRTEICIEEKKEDLLCKRMRGFVHNSGKDHGPGLGDRVRLLKNTRAYFFSLFSIFQIAPTNQAAFSEY